MVLEIDTPKYVGRVVISRQGRVMAATQVVSWMMGCTSKEVRAFCRARGYTIRVAGQGYSLNGYNPDPINPP
jgi:hypothetical protein